MHGGALPVRLDPHGVGFALQGHHPVVADLAGVIVHRAGNAGAAYFCDAVHRGSSRGGAADGVTVQRGPLKAVGIFFGDEGGGDVAGHKAGMVHHCADEGQVMADAFDFESIKGDAHFFNRLQAGRGPGAKLGDHRIIEHADLAPLKNAGVIAHDATRRGRPFDGRAVAGQPADRGQEVAVGVFGIKPAFHRPAVDLEVRLRKGQRLTCGNADHLFHQIDAGDQLGHRMFHLQAGVHFQKVEIARPVDDEFDGAGAGVAHGPGQRAGLVAHRLARGRIKKG